MLDRLMLIPSFYGVIAWLFAVLVYLSTDVEIDSLSFNGWAYISYVILVMIVCTLITYLNKKNYKSNKIRKEESIQKLLLLFIAFSSIGIVGLLIRINEIGFRLGGLFQIIAQLSEDSLYIRYLDGEEGLGIDAQLSYFSWIGIFLGIAIIYRLKKINFFTIMIFLLVLFQVFGNFLYVDRTRPVLILFTSLFGLMSLYKDKIQAIKVKLFLAFLISVLFFMGFALFTGKYTDSVLSSIQIYIIGSLPYLDQLVNEPVYSFSFENTFYPIAKVLHLVGFIDTISNPVLFPKFIPFWFNTGTFMTPLLLDGGVKYSLILFPLMVISLNILAEKAFSYSAISSFLYGNIVFIFLISFFVPKYQTPAFYLFIFLFIIERFISLFTRKYRS